MYSCKPAENNREREINISRNRKCKIITRQYFDLILRINFFPTNYPRNLLLSNCEFDQNSSINKLGRTIYIIFSFKKKYLRSDDPQSSGVHGFFKHFNVNFHVHVQPLNRMNGEKWKKERKIWIGREVQQLHA